MSDKYTAVFTIDVTGDTTGEKFPGVFKIKTRLSFRDALERDKIRRALLGDQPDGASIRANNIADIFSELAVRIVDAPSWWVNADNGLTLEDDNLIREIAEATARASAAATADLTKKADAAKKDLAKE